MPAIRNGTPCMGGVRPLTTCRVGPAPTIPEMVSVLYTGCRPERRSPDTPRRIENRAFAAAWETPLPPPLFTSLCRVFPLPACLGLCCFLRSKSLDSGLRKRGIRSLLICARDRELIAAASRSRNAVTSHCDLMGDARSLEVRCGRLGYSMTLNVTCRACLQKNERVKIN